MNVLCFSNKMVECVLRSTCLMILICIVREVESARSPLLPPLKYINCVSNRLNKDSTGTDFLYGSLRDYTRDMCAQCYSYMLMSGLKTDAFLRGRIGNASETERTFRPFTYFHTANSGTLCKYNGTPPTDCIFPNPANFNKTHPSEDPILRTFSSEFYMVSGGMSKEHTLSYERSTQ